MRLLFIGDIVGKGGRQAVASAVPAVCADNSCDFVIANGENMAGGGGMRGKCAKELHEIGVDVITGGDHMWDHKEFVEEITDLPSVLRPANVNPVQPGRGHGIFKTGQGRRVGVICLQGQTFMGSIVNSPFETAEKLTAELEDTADFTVVDFHAEATSEKIAMGRFLDGRVSAVLGTHTHVPTADEQIFPGGTAYQTDVGMAGSRNSVLGRAIEPVVKKFTTGLPARFDVVKDDIRVCATIIDLDDDTGKAVSIERIIRDL